MQDFEVGEFPLEFFPGLYPFVQAVDFLQYPLGCLLVIPKVVLYGFAPQAADFLALAFEVKGSLSVFPFARGSGRFLRYNRSILSLHTDFSSSN